MPASGPHDTPRVTTAARHSKGTELLSRGVLNTLNSYHRGIHPLKLVQNTPLINTAQAVLVVWPSFRPPPPPEAAAALTGVLMPRGASARRTTVVQLHHHSSRSCLLPPLCGAAAVCLSRLRRRAAVTPAALTYKSHHHSALQIHLPHFRLITISSTRIISPSASLRWRHSSPSVMSPPTPPASASLSSHPAPAQTSL